MRIKCAFPKTLKNHELFAKVHLFQLFLYLMDLNQLHIVKVQKKCYNKWKQLHKIYCYFKFYERSEKEPLRSSFSIEESEYCLLVWEFVLYLRMEFMSSFSKICTFLSTVQSSVSSESVSMSMFGLSAILL